MIHMSLSDVLLVYKILRRLGQTLCKARDIYHIKRLYILICFTRKVRMMVSQKGFFFLQRCVFCISFQVPGFPPPEAPRQDSKYQKVFHNYTFDKLMPLGHICSLYFSIGTRDI